MVGRFVEVYKIRDLKVNAGNIKVMVLNGEEGVECGGAGEWEAIGACVGI